MFLKNQINQLRNHFWLSWFLILSIVFGIHCLTLTISPPIWQDEVQIIEYGRTFLNPVTDWSINWDTFNNRPFLNLFYLGPLLQELAFKVAGNSIAGSRIFALIGASLAATTATGWLSHRQIPRKISALLGLTLLLDPVFVQSYRGDRLDCWVFAICFTVCWLLRLSIKSYLTQKYQSSLIFVWLAGNLSALIFFVWPSGLILYPLIAGEFCSLLYSIIKTQNNWKKCLHILLVFIVAGIAMTILLLIPIINNLSILINNFQEFSSKIYGGFGISSFILMLKSLKITPILIVLSVFGLIYTLDLGVTITTLLALFLILNSWVYIYRSIYILPYLILLFSGIYCQQKIFNFIKITSKIKIIFLLLMLAWATSFSLVLRPTAALVNIHDRNLDLLTEIATNYIGEGEYKIWDSTLQFYQAGRSLGWKMYHTFTTPEIKDQEDRNDFLNKLDYIILPKSADDPYYYYEMIEKYDFKLKGTMKIITYNQKQQGVLYNITKFLKSQASYGPYNLYSKY